MSNQWENITSGVNAFINAVAPVVTAFAPGLSEAVSLGQKIVQGVIAAEPAAVALYDQITSGTPPTPDQLQKYAEDYEASYQRLNADINAKLAALSSG